MTPLLPPEMEALNIVRKRKSIDYLEGLDTSSKKESTKKRSSRTKLVQIL